MTAVQKGLLYFHTLRHLRPIQIYGRIAFHLRRPSPDLRPPPALRALKKSWVTPAARRASISAPETFFFLNQEGFLPEIGWDGPQRNKLWRYNQHYFDDLNAEGQEERGNWHRALLTHWVEANPPGCGVGWDPYPTSLRIVNWVKWALSGHPLPEICIQSLAVQARWLTKRLEWHLLGNHLFANAKALVFAGLFFEGAEAEQWLQTGLSILEQEVPEQILPDGGQFERTPMYHALALEDMLDLMNLLKCAPRSSLRSTGERFFSSLMPVVQKMRRWLMVMSHPDGKISFFNDAAFGVAPENTALEAYAQRCKLDPVPPLSPVERLPDSGYVRLQTEDAVLIFDAAPVGPDYLPGHAHADTLSFELSVFGERVIVNSGTSEYGMGMERHRQRGTAAHNTITIDGQDSSEIWGGFRVARRARILRTEISCEKPLSVSACHDGYKRLYQMATHCRQIELDAGRLSIKDRLAGAVGEGAIAHFHVHPSLHSIDKQRQEEFSFQAVAGTRFRLTSTPGTLSAKPSTWHPAFGKAILNTRVDVSFSGLSSNVTISWKA